MVIKRMSLLLFGFEVKMELHGAGLRLRHQAAANIGASHMRIHTSLSGLALGCGPGRMVCCAGVCQHVLNALGCFRGIRYALSHSIQQDVYLADQEPVQHCQLASTAAQPTCGEPLPVPWQCSHAVDSATKITKFGPPLAVPIPPLHLLLVADGLWTSRVAAALGAVAVPQQLTHKILHWLCDA